MALERLATRDDRDRAESGPIAETVHGVPERSSSKGAEYQPTRWPAVLLAANVLAALAFVALSSGPVFDDPNHLRDVARYVRDGIDVQSLRAHQNPTGPLAFVWMAVVGPLLGSGVDGYRRAIVACWLLMGLVVLWQGRHVKNPVPWAGALTAALVFPHSMTATATMLTEGPAIALSVVGLLVWSRAGERVGMALLGGFFIGLAVTCRQYYLALLGALAAPLAVAVLRQTRPLPIRSLAFGLVGGALPVLGLLGIWGGFSSPAMVAGASYGVVSKVALNGERPFIALFYLALYLLPFGLPFAISGTGRLRAVSLAIAVAVGAGAGLLGWSWLSWGPFRSAVESIDGRLGIGIPLVGAVAFAGAYSAVGWAVATFQALREGRSPEFMVSVAFLLLFVLEQAAVGGGIQFYERYALQLAPFIGLASWTLWPRDHLVRSAACVAMWVAGQGMLWRYL